MFCVMFEMFPINFPTITFLNHYHMLLPECQTFYPLLVRNRNYNSVCHVDLEEFKEQRKTKLHSICPDDSIH